MNVNISVFGSEKIEINSVEIYFHLKEKKKIILVNAFVKDNISSQLYGFDEYLWNLAESEESGESGGIWRR